jgi:hypothetical protein
VRTPVLALVAALTAACASASPVTGSGADDPASLYRSKCSGCHRPYEPASRTVTQWQAILDRMARKARLSPEQEKVLRGWLTASAADAPRGAEGSAR